MSAMGHRIGRAARPLLLLAVGAALVGAGVVATPVQPTASAEAERIHSVAPTRNPAPRPHNKAKRAVRRARAAPTLVGHQPSAPAPPAPGGRRGKRPTRRPAPTRTTTPPFQPSAPGERAGR